MVRTMKYADEILDELFRRASEKFPLTIRLKDWNKLRLKLKQFSKNKIEHINVNDRQDTIRK